MGNSSIYSLNYRETYYYKQRTISIINKLRKEYIMKKNRITRTIQTLALGLIALCLTIPTARAQYQQDWVATYNGQAPIPGWETTDWVNDMVVRDGYIYVTGYEAAATAYWATVKYNYSGQEIWVQRLTDGQSQTAEALVVDEAGNVYVCGYQKQFGAGGEVATVKYSPDGDMLWKQLYASPGGNNQPNDIEIDASGNIYITGASWVTAQDDFDLLLLKYNTDGELLWDRTLDNGDGQLDTGYELNIGPYGNVIIAGLSEPKAYLVKYNSSGDLLWQDEHVGYSTNDEWKRVETDSVGNIYVLGEISPPGESNNLWATKYDPDGNIIWEDNYIGTGYESCYTGNLAIMPDGGVVVTGQSFEKPHPDSSYNSIVTIRYAADGTKLWQQLEKAGYAHASGDDVALDTEGNIYITGYGFNYSYWEDIITMMYSPDGDLLWTQIYAGSEPDQSDYPKAIAVDENANVFVTGQSWNPGTSSDFITIRYSQEIAQTIPLNTGFQFVSSRIDVENPDMLIVLEDILNENLAYVRNSNGEVLRKIGPNWVNGIGEWIVDEGYLFKMFADDSFTITGSLVNPSTPVPVAFGFQFVSYFPENPMDALDAFATIIGDDLDFIRNSQGQTLRKIGPNWINGIGDCQPGEGYLVKMFADGEIIYPASAKSSNKTTIHPINFIFKGGNPAEAVYSIYIKGLEIGDEVAAFDGDKIVGSTRINSEDVFENELAVFSSRIEGQGYKAGNQITLKVLSDNNIVSADFTMETIYDSYVSDVYPEGDGKYSIVNITKGRLSEAEEIINVYPNPATNKITIQSTNEIIGVVITNSVGQVMYKGSHKNSLININTESFENGIYFIRIESENSIFNKKIIIEF